MNLGKGLGYKVCYDCIGASGCKGWCTCLSACICCHCTKVSPPNLATCWFKAQQNGTFRVNYATGKYKGLRYSGQFWTHISGRLKAAGHDQCGSKIVYYRTVTYEIGKIP